MVAAASSSSSSSIPTTVTTERSVGTGTFCLHSFGNNRSIKAGSIMLA